MIRQIRYTKVTRLVAIVICVLSFGNVATAQSSNLRAGVAVHPALTWFSTGTPDIETTRSQFGLQFAAVVEYKLGERVYLSSGMRFNINYGGGLTYARGGTFWPKSDLSDEQFRTVPAGTTIDYNIQYVEVPLGLVYYTGEIGTGTTRAYIESPTLSLILSSRARGEALLQGTGDQNILDDVRFLNFGLGFGAGIMPDWLGGTDVKLGLSYQTIFTDTLNDGVYEDGSREDSKAKLGVLSFKFVVLL